MNPIASLLDMVIIPERWVQSALCAETGGDDPFATREDPSAVRRALNVCNQCPVAAECLEYAVRTKQTRGTWGGRTQPELRKLRSGT